MVLDVGDIFARSLEYFFFILFITFLILGDQERARIHQVLFEVPQSISEQEI